MKFFTLRVAVTLAVISLGACGSRSSDDDKVRALFADAETAAEERDASDVLEFVADDYEDGNGFDKSQLRDFLRGYFLANPKVELLVKVDDLHFPADGLAPLVQHALGGPIPRLGKGDPLATAYLAAVARTAEYVNGLT